MGWAPVTSVAHTYVTASQSILLQCFIAYAAAPGRLSHRQMARTDGNGRCH